MINVTNQTFLSTVAAACPVDELMWTCFFAGDPFSAPASMWAGMHRAPNGGARP